MNLEQRPSMPRLIASETGVIATVTVAAIAVTGVLLATGVHVGKTPARPATTQAAPVPAQTTSVAKREMRGADLDADQPFYDESAGMMVGRR